MSDAELRIDPLTGGHVVVTPWRQQRPNLPEGPCPFCPGGLEAPGPYDVRHIPNRWPALPGGRHEIILHCPDHDASFPVLGEQRSARVVELWSARTALGPPAAGRRRSLSSRPPPPAPRACPAGTRSGPAPRRRRARRRRLLRPGRSAAGRGPVAIQVYVNPLAAQVRAAVTGRFARNHWPAPRFLAAMPSGGARRLP